MTYKIIIDNREPLEFDLKITRAFLPLVKKIELVPDIIRMNLKTGDYLFAEVDDMGHPERDDDGFIVSAVGAERKSMSDFSPDKMQDVLSKCSELVSHCPNPYLLIEGSSFEYAERWRLSSRSKSYFGFLASLGSIKMPAYFMEDDNMLAHVFAGLCIKNTDKKDRIEQYTRTVKKGIDGNTVFTRFCSGFSGVNLGMKLSMILAQFYQGDILRFLADIYSGHYARLKPKQRKELGLPKLNTDKIMKQLTGQI